MKPAVGAAGWRLRRAEANADKAFVAAAAAAAAAVAPQLGRSRSRLRRVCVHSSRRVGFAQAAAATSARQQPPRRAELDGGARNAPLSARQARAGFKLWATAGGGRVARCAVGLPPQQALGKYLRPANGRNRCTRRRPPLCVAAQEEQEQEADDRRRDDASPGTVQLGHSRQLLRVHANLRRADGDCTSGQQLGQHTERARTQTLIDAAAAAREFSAAAMM